MRGVVFSPDGRFAADDITAALYGRDWEVLFAADELELGGIVRRSPCELIIIQSDARPQAALPIAQRIRASDRHALLLLLVHSCDSDLALMAMRAGFNDVLTAGRDAVDITGVLGRIAGEPPEPPPRTEIVDGERLVGCSRSIEQLRQSIRRVAVCDSNVLITGETGTGKELTAEMIHRNSRRRDRPFVSINCAAIPDGLLESELFGYERGAFTGAVAAREGKLQYAGGGTLFLDEVGDMSLYAQAKILRVIESRKVQRLGANREYAVNVRIIAATNHNLEQLTSQQKFRQDLYFRLNVARLQLPALRDHLEDIPDLVAHIVAELSERLERRIDSIDATFIDALLRYSWPGNIRELRNVLESTMVFGSDTRLGRRDLPPYLRALFASEQRKNDSEQRTILEALRAARWNRNEAARILGCSRMTLYRRMVRYNLFSAEGESGAATDVRVGA